MVGNAFANDWSKHVKIDDGDEEDKTTAFGLAINDAHALQTFVLLKLPWNVFSMFGTMSMKLANPIAFGGFGCQSACRIYDPRTHHHEHRRFEVLQMIDNEGVSEPEYLLDIITSSEKIGRIRSVG